MSASLPPTAAPFSTRLGGALAVAVPASMIAAVPAALRLSESGALSLVHAWALLTGLVVLPVAILGLVGRRAYLGWCGLGPDEAGLRLAAAFGWLAWTALLADRVGAILRAKTHHHALAGVTFSLAIIVTAMVLALVARRVFVLLRDLDRRHETLTRAVAIVWVAVPIFGLVLAFRAAAPDLAPDARATVIDGAALALGAIVASRSLASPQRALVVGGPVVFLTLLAIGIAGLRGVETRGALDAAAPLLARLVVH
ncbi:hypothetical protein BH09MYX1_BH09MYX1_63100 [soil metagenome]